jgi:hydroxyacylglutathione hydrolase
MLTVKQFRNDSDNLSYLIYGEKHAVAVDGVASNEILRFIKKQKLNLLFVTNTHGHPDHTSGNGSLLNASAAKLLHYEEITKNSVIELAEEKINVIDTPGHTNDSVCFYFNNYLITGDTLFNGTVGNCFSGSLENFYYSIKKIMRLHEETVIYAGHDYVKDSMTFARKLEPDNTYIDIFLRNYNPSHPVSALMEEKKINPYLRFNEKSIIEVLKKNNLPWETELQRWLSLMSIE